MKIPQIEELRTLSGLGLKEAKELIELALPFVALQSPKSEHLREYIAQSGLPENIVVRTRNE